MSEMRTFVKRFAALFFVVFVLSGVAAAQEDVVFPVSTLTLNTETGAHEIAVEVATTPAERQRGLMYRTALAKDHGMIFNFGKTRTASMWMVNTLIPLDMVFIEADGTVAGYHENAEPGSKRIIVSSKPVRYVLELGGGEAATYHLQPGDRVSGPALGQ